MKIASPARGSAPVLQLAKCSVLALGMGWVLGVPALAQEDNAAPQPPPPDTTAAAQGSDGQTPLPPGQGQAPTSQDATGPTAGVTFQTFYDSLGSLGNWIQTQQYGYVWQPNVNDPNWAPYTDGNWVYTEAGWTWNSNEPWGWATYHYGRWVNLDGYGWVWVPGYTWAPAWVSWRYGDGYVGWAPLPPDSFAGIDYSSNGYDADYGFHIGGDVDDYYGIGPELYIFIPIGCVGYHDYHHWYHNRHDNYGLVNHTTNVTNINVTRGGAVQGAATFTHVTVGGPLVSQVDAASETPVTRASLAQAGSPKAASLSGNTLAVYAPRVTTAATAARPATVTATLGATTINRGTDIERPLAVNPHLAPAPASVEQITAARSALDSAPASAKVLTDASAVRPVFQGSLVTLKPAAAPAVVQQPHGYTFAPSAVYNSPGTSSVYGPVHLPNAVGGEGETPSERTAREAQQTVPQQRIYSPTPSYIPHYTPPAGGREATTESHTYTHATPAPAATPSAQPSYRAPESSGGGYSESSHAASSPAATPSSGAASSGGGYSNSSRGH